MSIKINDATNIFINNNVINLKENDKNSKLLYIKNFFYQIITLGLKRSLFEVRAEEKKELFNMAFSIFKAMHLSFSDIKKDYQRDMYFSPCRKYKIYQCEYNIYISKLDRNGDEIIDSRIELANLSKREYFENFKKKFSEIKEHDSYKKIVDTHYKIISELKYFNINILDNLKEVAIRYTIENNSNYLNNPDNFELKKKLEKTSRSFKEYIENKIETRNFGMDDLIPMIHFFLESDQELQRILLNTDIHESYMFDVMDKKLDSNNKILSNQDELKIQNWQNISRVLKMISNSKALSNGTNEIVNNKYSEKFNLIEEIDNHILQNSEKYPSTSEYIRKYIKNS
ncbi:hypothetical protein [Arsenophonus sp. PmNCSU2021_1]|uniref:hypothetical protein n=1 Tax=Arsenophonus sp. PmNCSU2021_1 TaxID=3118989 RepID=UPI002FF16C1C